MFFRNLFLAVTLIAAAAVAGDSERHSEVGDVSVYLGVIPAQLVKGHEKMHGGPGGKESYHILVALFDIESGERITDAKVSARVASVGMRGEKKELQPMHGELLSYGNYFLLERPGRYSIEVEILRKGEKSPLVTRFAYLRPAD